MTTITVTPREKSLPYAAQLLTPFHHGAGASGNTSLLRTHEVVQPDGTVARVPFLSAASIRHALRDRIAWHMADVLHVEPASLTKAAVDLLWTGGAVTSTGAEVDLDLARRIEALLPSLGLFGYAARSDIIEGTLRASDLILGCAENSWRIDPATYPWLPEHTRTLRAAAYRGEQFGTRHDIATSPVSRLIADAETLTGTTSTQMIFDSQIVATGSWMVGSLQLTAGATPAHHMVLSAACQLWAPDGAATIGAKTGQGFGRVTIHGLPDGTTQLEQWTQHLTAHRDDILALVAEVSR